MQHSKRLSILLTALVLPVGLAGAQPGNPSPKPAQPEATAKAEKPSTAKPPEKPKELTPGQLRDKMRELENELRRTRSKYAAKADGNKKKKPKPVSVDTINLPEEPTRQDYEHYMSRLREAARNTRGYNTNNPIVGKLKSVPPEHLDLLFNEIGTQSRLRSFCNYALREHDPEVIRESVTGHIPVNNNTIGVIVMNGWCQDIRPQIVEKISNADGSLSIAWFQAAIEVNDPSLYQKMHEITINSRYAGQFINMLKGLPEYDIVHTVNTCWQHAKQGKIRINPASIAQVAAERGNVDALGVLIGQLQNTTNYMVNSYSYNSKRVNVLHLIEFTGSNAEIKEWLKRNKDNLIFDHHRKRFVLPKEF